MGDPTRTAVEAIEELVDRETRAWNTKDLDLLMSLFHPDMVWPWPPHAGAHDPVDWVIPWGRYDDQLSLDGSVRIAADDRAGLERLLRYCARPLFALHRLRPASSRVRLESPDARLIDELPRPAHDGRTGVRVGPLELLDRLARLIPPPRVHRHRYHGILGPNAKWRREAIRYGRDDVDDLDPASATTPASGGTCTHSADRGPRRRWAQLLARVYEVHPLRCPACHGEMRILAFLTDPGVVRPILRHLRIPEHPPPVAPARRRPSSSPSIRLRRGIGTPTRAPTTPSIRACREMTAPGARETRARVGQPPHAKVLPNAASRRRNAPSAATRA